MRSAGAARVARHRTRARRATMQADNYGQPWDAGDDFELRYGAGSITARAHRIGRTYRAARARLESLQYGDVPP